MATITNSHRATRNRPTIPKIRISRMPPKDRTCLMDRVILNNRTTRAATNNNNNRTRATRTLVETPVVVLPVVEFVLVF